MSLKGYRGLGGGGGGVIVQKKANPLYVFISYFSYPCWEQSH